MSRVLTRICACATAFCVPLAVTAQSEGTDDVASAVVNTVRQQYDNLGVSPSTQGTEVYTVNTKIWVPDGLVSHPGGHTYPYTHADPRAYPDRDPGAHADPCSLRLHFAGSGIGGGG